jgi:hypothetical protein
MAKDTAAEKRHQERAAINAAANKPQQTEAPKPPEAAANTSEAVRGPQTKVCPNPACGFAFPVKEGGSKEGKSKGGFNPANIAPNDGAALVAVADWWDSLASKPAYLHKDKDQDGKDTEAVKPLNLRDLTALMVRLTEAGVNHLLSDRFILEAKREKVLSHPKFGPLVKADPSLMESLITLMS